MSFANSIQSTLPLSGGLQMFRQKDTPAYYELDVVDEGRTILIHIEKSMWERTIALFRASPFLRDCQRNLKIPEFIFPGPLPWGFGPFFAPLRREDLDSAWVTVTCELPQLFRDSFYANDDKDPSLMAWQRGTSLCASLHVLFYTMEYLAFQTEGLAQTSSKQLLEVTVGIRADTDRRIHFISSQLSNRGYDWLEKQAPNSELAFITFQMRAAYQRIFGKEELDRYDQCYIHADITYPCSISFSTVGDRTGLGSYTNRKQEYGLDLYDHNVDSPMQQLVLLIGLASLHAQMRKEGH